MVWLDRLLWKRRRWLQVYRAAVDHDRLPGDKFTHIAGEVQNGAHQILGFKGLPQGLIALDGFGKTVAIFLHHLTRPWRINHGGRNRIDANVVPSQFTRERTGKADNGAFRRCVVQERWRSHRRPRAN